MSKKVFITGGSGLIGLTLARNLVSNGHEVTLYDLAEQFARRQVEVDKLVAGGKVRTAVGTIMDRWSVTLASKGADVVVHLAAMLGVKRTEDNRLQCMDVNVNGVFHCTQIALEAMLSAGWGRIINIASVASLRGFPYVSGYCASKHAVLGLTRAVALEVATQGVTVNAICPGYVDTDIVRAAIAEIVSKTGRTEDEAMEHFTQSNPQGRLIKASEVASAVSWLCSDGAASVTGQAIAIDGGGTA